MSIMQLRSSRLLRASAAITLCSFLVGCLPGNLKSNDTTPGSASDLSNASGSLLASLSSVTGMANDTAASLGLSSNGRTGMDFRSWSEQDQQRALAAKKLIEHQPLDDLPVYDPTKPGEVQRYGDQVKALLAKYGQKTELSADELREVSRTVVPMVRYIAKSRAYREGKQAALKMTRNKNGMDSIVIPPGMTVGAAILTYCNDHGLAAPWRGSKMSLRPAANYMPPALLPLSQDLHKYAAVNPQAHYAMQGLVWWLRDTPCEPDRLSDTQRKLIEAAHPGGLAELSSFCVGDKFKKQALEHAKNYLPGNAASMLSKANSVMAQANGLQQKAEAFLEADLSDPRSALELAQTAGLKLGGGKSDLLNNPYFKSAVPLLKDSNISRALIPASIDDKAVDASLAAMNALGERMAAEAGDNSQSLADYSLTENGLAVKNNHDGGASNSQVVIHNPTGQPLEFVGRDYVLSTVDDGKSSKGYRPSQRLSIGPLVPTTIYPDPHASKYSEKLEDATKKALEPLSTLPDTAWGLASEAKGEKLPCEPKGGFDWKVIGLSALKDVVETIPVISNIVNGYSALTGRDWMTGKELDGKERMLAILSAALPASGAIVNIVGKRGRSIFDFAKKGWEYGDRAQSTASTVNTSGELIAAAYDDNKCKVFSSAMKLAATHVCKGAQRASCMKSTAALSVAANTADQTEIGKVKYEENILSAPGKVGDAVKGMGDALGNGFNSLTKGMGGLLN